MPVRDLILEKLPVTIQLASMAIVIALLIGVTAGIVSAVKKGTIWDYAANAFALWGISTPNFWLGIMLIFLFSVQLGWLPASGYVRPVKIGKQALPPPSCRPSCSAMRSPAVLMRHTRSAMLQVLESDYIRTARAKGLLERTVILKHAMRNALTPVITLGALELGTLLSGAVLTEQIFTIPGFGKLIVDAVFNRDYAVVQGVVLVTATTYIALNLLADIATSSSIRGCAGDAMTDAPFNATLIKTDKEAVETPLRRCCAGSAPQGRDFRPRHHRIVSLPGDLRAVAHALRSDRTKLDLGAKAAVGRALVRHRRCRPRYPGACHLRHTRLADGRRDLDRDRTGDRRTARPRGGLSRRILDALISRITDAMLACPFLILAIALAAFLGPSLGNAMIAIGVTTTPILCG